MATILLYESDEVLARKVFAALRKEGHTVERCDPEHPVAVCSAEDAAVILDARLKWTECRPLLETFQGMRLPVLFLTADREMTQHLRALYPASSDVLLLPLSPKALYAKLAALIGGTEPLSELSIDESERVALLDGQRVELTAQEFALLLALMENPETPVSREQLLRKAWGYQSMGETRTVDVHVQRLRKKLGDERIETVYKCGYRLKLA